MTDHITKSPKVKALLQVGKKTEAFIRFSTVAGECGAADAARGFALRVYTEDGNWDMISINAQKY